MKDISIDLDSQLADAKNKMTKELSPEFFSNITGGGDRGKDFYLNCEPGSGCGGSGQGFLKGMSGQP